MDNLAANFKAAKYALEILVPPLVLCLIVALSLARAHKSFVKKPYWACTMIFLVFCVFGMTIGMFMGASKSEIVSSLLPPIITLVAGYIVYLGSKDLASEFKALVPGCVFVLLLLLLFSAFYMKSWYRFVSA